MTANKRHNIKQNSTAPTLVDKAVSTDVDGVETAATFPIGTTFTFTAKGPATITGPATWNSTAATLTYDWVAGNTAIPGLYRYYFIATLPGPKTQELPTSGYGEIEIEKSL
jgi:hypothetical protein